MRQALHTWILGFSAILLCRSSQALSGWSVHSYFQVYPEIGFKSGLWQSHSRTFTPGRCPEQGEKKENMIRGVRWSLIKQSTKDRVIPKPLLHCLACVLRVICETLAQSEVLSALEQVFIKDLSVLCSIHISLDPRLPVPATEKTSPQHYAATTMLHCRDNICIWAVPGFLDTWHSGQTVQSWFHQTWESCFSWSGSPLGAFCKTPSGLSCAFYWGTAAIWPLYHKGLISGMLLEGSHISTE